MNWSLAAALRYGVNSVYLSGVNEGQFTEVQGIYAAFAQGDMNSILAVLSPDVDWIQYCPKDAIPFGGHYHGHEGIIQFFTLVGQNAEVEQYETCEFQVAGQVVVVEGWQRVKVREYYNMLLMAQAFAA